MEEHGKVPWTKINKILIQDNARVAVLIGKGAIRNNRITYIR